MTVQNNDVLRVDIGQTLPATNNMLNVYHMRLQAGGPVAEADVLTDLAVILQALANLIKVIQSTQLVYDIIKIINKTQSNEVGVLTTLLGQTGSLGADAEPAQIAYGITLSTTRLASVGRKFVPGTEESGNVNGGLLIAARIVSLGLIVTHLTAQQVNAGRTYEYGIDSVPALAFLPFQTGSITPTMVTQRRRRIGVGS